LRLAKQHWLPASYDQPVRIYGLDFTSVPSASKPITCAQCELNSGLLSVRGIEDLNNFDEFDQFLRRDGPWVAGIDFPFGQPSKLIHNLRWPGSWEHYVKQISDMSAEQFAECLTKYQEHQPIRDKHHFRATDLVARSRSPMMLYRVPVAKMFLRGAPCLLKASVSVLPCRRTADDRLVVEAYPTLVARRWVPRAKYKGGGSPSQMNTQVDMRRKVIDGLLSGSRRAHYGCGVELTDALADACVQDGRGDRLDAVLCAVQAAWAYLQREHNYGIPGECDRNEGWIVDPSM
jgi:hypothetical protein